MYQYKNGQLTTQAVLITLVLKKNREREIEREKLARPLLLDLQPSYSIISSWTLILRVLFGRTMLLSTTTSSSTFTASPGYTKTKLDLLVVEGLSFSLNEGNRKSGKHKTQ